MFWSYTARTPSILFIDARAFLPGVILCLNIFSGILWLITITSIIFFAVLSKIGLPPPVLLRKIRHKICGNFRAARPWWYWKQFRV